MDNILKTKEILYNLFIYTLHDETLKKNFVVFRIETEQEFENFRYEIDVNVFHKQNEIIFRMRGLKPTKINLPGGGRAFFEKKFENLQGNYRIEIIGINKKVNNFEINIVGDLIKIISVPKESFLNIQVS
ncbi:MAG: hypothetical protein IGBAC_0701 [Ignavibacteriae bacterium]|nr:MAG: hypothetical protein IGBAC_0701 [Ignavibacteriota bacterium]